MGIQTHDHLSGTQALAEVLPLKPSHCHLNNYESRACWIPSQRAQQNATLLITKRILFV